MANSSTKAKDKKEVSNPNTGRRMQIDAKTWELFYRAIKHSLRGGRALTFTELVDAISDYFKKNKIKFTQSVGWYAVTIKHDLHVRKVLNVYTEKGRKLHSWNKDEE